MRQMIHAKYSTTMDSTPTRISTMVAARWNTGIVICHASRRGGSGSVRTAPIHKLD